MKTTIYALLISWVLAPQCHPASPLPAAPEASLFGQAILDSQVQVVIGFRPMMGPQYLQLLREDGASPPSNALTRLSVLRIAPFVITHSLTGDPVPEDALLLIELPDTLRPRGRPASRRGYKPRIIADEQPWLLFLVPQHEVTKRLASKFTEDRKLTPELRSMTGPEIIRELELSKILVPGRWFALYEDRAAVRVNIPVSPPIKFETHPANEAIFSGIRKRMAEYGEQHPNFILKEDALRDIESLVRVVRRHWNTEIAGKSPSLPGSVKKELVAELEARRAAMGTEMGREMLSHIVSTLKLARD